MYLFFSEISGTVPTSSNGCSNDIMLPSVQLNTSVGTITDFEKSILSSMLAAQAQGSVVRIRFDDQTKLLVSAAVNR